MALRNGTFGVTGFELRARRRGLDVSQDALARRMGVVRQRVGQAEAMAQPSETLARRYLAALLAEADARRTLRAGSR
jgi:DNA-binding XRE family transcriptional regulator